MNGIDDRPLALSPESLTRKYMRCTLGLVARANTPRNLFKAYETEQKRKYDATKTRDVGTVYRVVEQADS